jgi:CheY-like chemotaxis protein
MKDAALAGRSLTKELLAFGRQQLLRPRVIDMNDVVPKVEKMLARVLEADVELRTRLRPGIGNVLADPVLLEAVVLNLVLNARDAMPEGGVLTVETSEVLVDETYVETHVGARPGRFVVLSVADTGVGMDEATREKIFEPFFTTKPRGKGSGMGLAMVYGTVKQSDGNIWVYSEPGVGTTFKIYLPVVDAPAEKTPVAVPVPRAVGGGRILFVEDNDAVRKSVRRILETFGYSVEVESDAAAAVARLAGPDAGVDLLITDVVMPAMSGLELAEQVAVVHPSLRVLFVSGHSVEVAFRGRVPTVHHSFLEKPFTAEELSERVRELLGHATAM